MKIYSHTERFMVWRVKALLEEQGIPCFIKNEFAIGAIGELAPMDVLPEVWLVDSEWEARARQLINEVSAAQESPPWICPHCGEKNEGAFEVCWQCGRDPKAA